MQKVHNMYGPPPTDPESYSVWLVAVCPLSGPAKTALLGTEDTLSRLRSCIAGFHSYMDRIRMQQQQHQIMTMQQQQQQQQRNVQMGDSEENGGGGQLNHWGGSWASNSQEDMFEDDDVADEPTG